MPQTSKVEPLGDGATCVGRGGAAGLHDRVGIGGNDGSNREHAVEVERWIRNASDQDGLIYLKRRRRAGKSGIGGAACGSCDGNGAGFSGNRSDDVLRFLAHIGKGQCADSTRGNYGPIEARLNRHVRTRPGAGGNNSRNLGEWRRKAGARGLRQADQSCGVGGLKDDNSLAGHGVYPDRKWTQYNSLVAERRDDRRDFAKIQIDDRDCVARVVGDESLIQQIVHRDAGRPGLGLGRQAGTGVSHSGRADGRRDDLGWIL